MVFRYEHPEILDEGLGGAMHVLRDDRVFKLFADGEKMRNRFHQSVGMEENPVSGEKYPFRLVELRFRKGPAWGSES